MMPASFLKKIENRLEKLKKGQFILLSLILFIVFLSIGWLIGSYSLRAYKKAQIMKLEAKLEQEAGDRLTKKLERFQVRIK